MKERVPARSVLLVDGVLGTGARSGWAPSELPTRCTVVACDLPYGVDADTGHVAAVGLDFGLTTLPTPHRLRRVWGRLQCLSGFRGSGPGWPGRGV